MNYKILYVDHRKDDQSIGCSAYEDAERVAQFIADLYGSCELTDDHYTRNFKRENDH